MKKTGESEAKKYLQEGSQTQITEQIKSISTTSLAGENEDFVKSTLNWISENLEGNDEPIIKSNVFRKRTADQIITDKYATGCTDDALVFIGLARAKGIPTKYIEAVNRDSEGDRGHVFAECLVNGNWIKVDPARREYQRKRDYPGYDIVAVGLDSWDCDTGS